MGQAKLKENGFSQNLYIITERKLGQYCIGDSGALRNIEVTRG